MSAQRPTPSPRPRARAIAAAILAPLALGACGHATATAPAAGPALANAARDAGAPAVRDAAPRRPLVAPDAEPPLVMPWNDPRYNPRFTYAEVAALVEAPQGPLTGAPAIYVERLADPARCGGEEVRTHFFAIPGLPPVEPVLAAALAPGPEPPASDPAAVKAWRAHMQNAAWAAYTHYRALADASGGVTHIEALATLVVLERNFLDAELHLPFTTLLHIAPLTARQLAGFCDQFATRVGVSVVQLRTDAAACRDAIAAADLGPSRWTDVCADRAAPAPP